MKRLRTFLITAVATGLSYGLGFAPSSQATAPAAAAERFPILTRFELPRDYGYFIGDEIPLTLVVETTKGMVLDLVNLPKPGEKHGLFEIRHVRLTTSSQAHEVTVYRAAYILQYFGVTPLTAHFEPLELLYAHAEERQGTTKTYSYKSLLTQPITLNMARIGPYGPTQALDIKGPVADARGGLVWGSLSVGVLCLLVAMASGGTQWYVRRKNRQVANDGNLSPVQATLETLRQEGAVLRPQHAAFFPGAERLQHLVRQYLQATFGVSATTLTTPELYTLLSDEPFGKELLNILERCDTAKYEPPLSSTCDVRQLWWETITVFEKLQQTDVS